MHAGKLATSKRLQATLKVISGHWWTTRAISKATGSMAVHSDIAALRAQGVNVESRYVGLTEEGNRTWAYRAPSNERNT